MKQIVLKDEILEKTSKIEEEVKELRNDSKQSEDGIKESLNRINCYMVGITKNLEEVAFGIRNKANRKSFKELCEEWDWLEEISLKYFFELQNALEINGKEEVTKKLKNDINNVGFLKELEKEISENEFLKRRSHIILKAVERHKKGDYISSIPLLLAQIEGIFWDMGQAKGFVEKGENSTRKIDKNGNFILNKKKEPEKWQLRELAKELFGNHSKLATKSSEIYSERLRHMVLHGRKTDYDNDLNSTILVLMLLMLLQKIKRC